MFPSLRIKEAPGLFVSEISFVDNILAGLGSDGPCVPVLIHLFKNSGLKGIANYFKLMVPNISKHFAINLEVLLKVMNPHRKMFILYYLTRFTHPNSGSIDFESLGSSIPCMVFRSLYMTIS
jgi:hypothetical protein